VSLNRVRRGPPQEATRWKSCSHTALARTLVVACVFVSNPQGESQRLIARDLQQVPGRKTDVKGAEWIAQLMRHGLLKRSFIPDVEQRDLRDLTRYRTRLVVERSSASNRLQKILDAMRANIKLSSVASNIQGVSARAMLAALIEGETDVAKLADFAQRRLRSKIPELEAALAGHIREHHRFMWREVLYRLDELNERLAPWMRRFANSPHLTKASSHVWMQFQALIGLRLKSFWPKLAQM
jgi:transposase